MAFTPSDNSGAVFKSDRMREGKKDPEYCGQGIVGGVPYWIDIWIKNNPKAPDYNPEKKTFLSLSFRPKDKPAAAKNQPPARRAAPPRPPSSESETDTYPTDQKF